MKLVDPSGEMLDQSWETHATALSNCPSTSSLISTFTTLASHLRVDLSAPASIVYARDTRPSGEELVAALERGLEAFGSSVKAVNVGVTTTPILHYVVKATNDKKGEYGKPTAEGYYKKMAEAFKVLVVSGTKLPGMSHVDGIDRAIEGRCLLFTWTAQMVSAHPHWLSYPSISATPFLCTRSTRLPPLPAH